MAPEYIIHGQLTEKADTCSYGILVIEIITCRKIQNSVSTSTEDHSLMSMVWQHFNTESLIKMLDDDLQGQCSEEEALNVFHVALLCTQASPALRPPMWKVVEMLASKSKELPIPTEPLFTNIRGADVYGEGSSISDNPITDLLEEWEREGDPVLAGFGWESFQCRVLCECPRQQNGVDCGYYVLRYMRDMILSDSEQELWI